jgi:hypothetical protein
MERESDAPGAETPREEFAPAMQQPQVPLAAEPRNIHRVGGASIDNLRLKPKEATLNPPGISVIKGPTPDAAAQEIRAGLPKAKKLHEQARTIGSAAVEAIQNVGFDLIATPSNALPNHYRLIHPDGAAGFSDENLARLVEAFVNTTGH